MALFNKQATDGVKAQDLEPGCIRPKTGTDGAKGSDTGSYSAAGFGTQRQAILDGLVSAQAEAAGWNALRSSIPLSAVVRTSASIVTITLPALPSYNITAPETITATVPGTAVASGVGGTASPAMGIAVAVGNTYSKSGTDGAKAADSSTALRTWLADTFTDTTGTLIQNHVGEVGATWTNHPGTLQYGRIASNRLRSNATASPRVAYASGVPANAAYVVRAPMYIASLPTGHVGAIAARFNTTTLTGYLFGYSVPLLAWGLWKINAGTVTLLQSSPATLTVGQTYNIELWVSDSAKVGTVGGVTVVSSTDNTITPAGRAAVYSDPAGLSATDTTGLHLDSITGTDEVAASLTKSATDGAKGTDSATAPRNRILSTPDGAKAVDTGTVTQVKVVAATDGAKGVDAATSGVGYLRTGTDGAKAQDSSAGARGGLKAGTDGAKATDASTRILGFVKSGTDGAKGVDASTVTHLTAKSGTDGAKGVDAGTGVSSRLGAGTDGAKAADSSTAPRIRPVSATDSAKAVESVTVLKENFTPPPVYANAAADGTRVSDSGNATGVYARTGTDGTKATEINAAPRDRAGTGTEGAKGTESATGPRTTPSVATDGAAGADSSTTTPVYVVSITDSVLAGDSGIQQKADVLTPSDGAKATDAAAIQHDIPKAITEGNITTDSATGLRTRAGDATDGITTSEAALPPGVLVAVANDGAWAGDSTTQGYDPHQEAKQMWVTSPELELTGITDVELVI